MRFNVSDEQILEGMFAQTHGSAVCVFVVSGSPLR